MFLAAVTEQETPQRCTSAPNCCPRSFGCAIESVYPQTCWCHFLLDLATLPNPLSRRFNSSCVSSGRHCSHCQTSLMAIQPIDLDAQQFCCDRSRFCAWRMQDVCEACSLRITAAAQQLQRCGSRCHYHSSTRRRTQLQLDQLPHADCTARRRCGGVSVFVVGQTCGGARENIITVFSS